MIETRPTKRTAFSYLLDVTSATCVIGVVVLLLIPHVQAARERARRSYCKNNLSCGCGPCRNGVWFDKDYNLVDASYCLPDASMPMYVQVGDGPLTTVDALPLALPHHKVLEAFNAFEIAKQEYERRHPGLYPRMRQLGQAKTPDL